MQPQNLWNNFLKGISKTYDRANKHYWYNTFCVFQVLDMILKAPYNKRCEVSQYYPYRANAGLRPKDESLI